MDLLELHQTLVSDRVTQEAYRKALCAALRGRETVLDLGTGTGLHALFACQAGAARVYAVDQHEIIALAQDICSANGYADRVRFFHCPVEELVLPERVDVIVTHQGLATLFALLPDARDRFLKPGGVLIPSSVGLSCAPVESANFHAGRVGFWEHRHFDLTLAPTRTIAAASPADRSITPAELLGASAHLASFDFSQVTEPALAASAATEVSRDGVMHGVGVWLTQWLAPDLAISNAPPSPLAVPLWPQMFLPVAEPIAVERGDVVRMAVQTGAGSWGKFWKWDVRVSDRQGQTRASGEHSNLPAWLLTKDMLRKQALDHRPEAKQLGEAARFVLEQCDGATTLGSIEESVLHRFPQLFRRRAQAARFVADLVARYTP